MPEKMIISVGMGVLWIIYKKLTLKFSLIVI